MGAEIEDATQPLVQVLGCRDMESVEVEARIVQVSQKVRVTAKKLDLGRLLGCRSDREEQNQSEEKANFRHHQFLQVYVTDRWRPFTPRSSALIFLKCCSDPPGLPQGSLAPPGDAHGRRANQSSGGKQSLYRKACANVMRDIAGCPAQRERVIARRRSVGDVKRRSATAASHPEKH
jgi:hypothetical protein